MKKDRMDGAGIAMLLALQTLLAFNQLIVKAVNGGLQPVFFAGLRSALAVLCLWAWLAFKGRAPKIRRASVIPGLLMGAVFAAEFIGLFLALDLTTVGRASVIMYSMPVWYAVLAHYGLGERITPQKGAGLSIAFLGCAWAILSRGEGTGGSLIGDLCALIAAWGWAGTAYIARRPVMRAEGPEMQLFWMVLVSAPIMLAVSPLFGPLLRDPIPLHWVGLIFQASVVVCGGFISWLWLMSVYPSSTVASFSFLSPAIAVLLGWFFLDESLSMSILGAVALVAVGIVLINRAPIPKLPPLRDPA